MLKNFGLMGALVGVLLSSTTANAIPIPIIDTVDQDVYVGWWETYEYRHELMDNDFVPGTAVSASLEIQFSDDGGWFDGWESIVIVVEELDLDSGGVIFSATSFLNDLEVNALAQINANGSLDVTIHSLFGDFYVGQSILTVETRPITIPEPAVLGLLGLGLLGLVATRRSQKT